MDIMKFESKFAKHLISKLVSKSIKKHLETDVGVWIDQMEFTSNEGENRARLHLDITLEAKPSELYSLIFDKL